MSSLFINFSNHPLEGWKEQQLEAAHGYADTLADLSFPNVSPFLDSKEIEELADLQMERIVSASNDFDEVTVHIVGEQTLVFRLVTLLKKQGYKCLASTTERITKELPDGKKLSEFKFVRFREY